MAANLWFVSGFEWLWNVLWYFLLCEASNISEMGNTDTKLAFRKAVVQLTTKKTVCRWRNKQLLKFAVRLFIYRIWWLFSFTMHWFSQALEAGDDAFWAQFWTDPSVSVSDIFTLIPATEIRSLRDDNPSNLATLLYKVLSTEMLSS